MKAGEYVTIEKGTPVHCTDGSGWKPAGRTYVVHAEVIHYGHFSVTTWPGSGGYWRRTVQQQNGLYVEGWPT